MWADAWKKKGTGGPSNSGWISKPRVCGSGADRSIKINVRRMKEIPRPPFSFRPHGWIKINIPAVNPAPLNEKCFGFVSSHLVLFIWPRVGRIIHSGGRNSRNPSTQDVEQQWRRVTWHLNHQWHGSYRSRGPVEPQVPPEGLVH